MLLTWAICMYCMSNLWLNPNNWIFGKDGDGLQTYYQSQWHLKYDTSYWHQSSMNYPYGESIFFTGGQPLISNVLRLLKPLVDLTDYTVAITNSLMLGSALLCAAFLFLIFQRLKLQPWMSLAAAILITFTTQQWHRMLGHYPLAWIYAVPGMLYLLMWYYEKISIKRSAIIVAYILFLSFGHIYYIMFFGVVACSFMLAHSIKSSSRERLKMLAHLFFQVALPFVILQFFVSYSSDVIDRTSLPWGFMVFRSSMPSYLYPFAVWYEDYFRVFHPKEYIETEGLSYIGIAAYVMLIALIISSVYYLLKKHFGRFKMEATGWAMLLSAFFAVLISFAFPFNLGNEDWLRFTGPLQQFRGIGRFAFVSFYPMMIFLFHRFAGITFIQSQAGRILFLIMVLFGLKEGIDRVSGFARDVSNERKEMLGSAEHLPEPIKSKKYQAILPMPYFHVGSENIWLADESMLTPLVFDVSYALGIPTFAALMSRTSVSQTFMSVELTRELMEYPAILKDLPSDDPILVIADTSRMNEQEALLLKHSVFLCNMGSKQCYELPLEVFGKVLEEKRNRNTDTTFRQDEFTMISDSSKQVLFLDIDTTFVFDNDWTQLVAEDIPDSFRGKKVLISFWVDDIVRDLIPRTSIEIIQYREKDVTGFDAGIPGKKIAGLLRGDALLEYEIEIDTESDRIEILARNKMLPGEKFRAFSFLIRPVGVNCTILRDGINSYNNRLFE